MENPLDLVLAIARAITGAGQLDHRVSDRLRGVGEQGVRRIEQMSVALENRHRDLQSQAFEFALDFVDLVVCQLALILGFPQLVERQAPPDESLHIVDRLLVCSDEHEVVLQLSQLSLY
jgi:hypothetical protein